MFKRNVTLAPRETDPFGLLRGLAADFDKFFAGADWPILRAGGKRESAGWWPGLDVYEKDDTLFAKVDLPGVKKEDVKIELVEGRLTISGERKHEVEEEKENVYRCERETGAFFRTIPLPDGVKAEQIAATFADGVLEVKIPLPAAAPAAQKIAIADVTTKAA